MQLVFENSSKNCYTVQEREVGIMDGIIFDLDGTLWDSTAAVAVAWNRALEEHTNIKKRVTEMDLKRVFGKPLKEIFELLFPEEDSEYLMSLSEKLYGYQHQYLVTEEGRPEPYEGAKEVLRILASQIPVFIVSNCQAGYIEVFFEATGLGTYITDHTCPGDTGMLKAENIRLIMERNGLNDVVYVGDTAGDEAACVKANVPIIHAAYGFGQVENPVARIQCMKELLQLNLDELQ